MNVCVERCPQSFAVQVNVNCSLGSGSVGASVGAAEEVEEMEEVV